MFMSWTLVEKKKDKKWAKSYTYYIVVDCYFSKMSVIYEYDK